MFEFTVTFSDGVWFLSSAAQSFIISRSLELDFDLVVSRLSFTFLLTYGVRMGY